MLASLLSALALNEMRRSARRAARSFTLALLAGLVGAIALGFLIAAGFIALVNGLGPIGACLVMTLVFALLSAVLFAIRAGLRRPRAASPVMMGALGGATAGAAAAPDAPPPRGRRPLIPGGAKLLLIPAAAFVAALYAARR